MGREGTRVAERTAELTQANRMLRQQITQRTLIEEELREAEQRYRTDSI